LRELSILTGTLLAQLCRELILMGAVVGFTRFQDPKEVEYLAKAAGLSCRAESVNKENPFKDTLALLARVQTAVARAEPARNRRSREGTRLVRIWLPAGFLRLVDLYGKLVKATRSALLINFLTRGYILYVGSRNIMMKALLQAAGRAPGNHRSRNHPNAH
jgi:hypothetical protein